MAIQDIVNANQGDYSLSPEQKFNIHSSTGMTPGELDQAAQDVSAYKDLSGLSMVQTTDAPTDLRAAKFAKAKNAFETHGLGFKPPSNKQAFKQMLGSLFIAYIGSRLLGAEKTDALALGLIGAGTNHDLINQQSENYKILLEEVERHPNIDPAAAFHFYETGDMKALEEGFKSEQSEKDRMQDRQWSQEDAQRAEQWRREDAAQAHQYQMEGKQYDVAHRAPRIGRGGSLGAGESAGGAAADARAKAIIETDVDPLTNKPASQQAMTWATNHLAANSGQGAKNGAGESLINLSNADWHEQKNLVHPLDLYRTTHSKALADWNKAKQADARMNAVDASTPAGQVAVAYQYLTVEAPTISNTVATAAHVSDEAVDGWADRINQILQTGMKNGHFTPKEIDELRAAAKAETKAMDDLMTDAAKSIASRYDLSDNFTAAAVEGATGIPASLLRTLAGQDKASAPATTASKPSTSGKTVDFNSLPK